MTDDMCEFWLEVEHHLTMRLGKMAVFAANGKLYNVTNQDAPVPIENVISADGYETTRLVTVVNKTMPGPAIEVNDIYNLQLTEILKFANTKLFN